MEEITIQELAQQKPDTYMVIECGTVRLLHWGILTAQC